MEQIKISADTHAAGQVPLVSQNVSINRPTAPSILPRNGGVNILNQTVGIDNIKSRLKQMGIEVKKILYFHYSDGSIVAALLYCMTTQGQCVIVEPPVGTTVYGGDLSLTQQRVGVLPTSTIARFAEALKNIYTGYAFICGGGIHFIRKLGEEPVLYGYLDYDSAERIFDIKKYHYLLVPAVSFDQLVEPVRMNTLEAYISMMDKSGFMKKAIMKTGLDKLLTMKGPMTIFMPDDEHLSKLLDLDIDRLKATLLAHVIVGRIDSRKGDEGTKETISNGQTLTDANQVSTLGSESSEFTAIAQNKISVQKVQGLVVKVSSGGTDARPSAQRPNSDQKSIIRRYNGIIHRIDSVFTPISQTFTMPTRSDIDDLITVFDITRSTMEIRKTQYTFNAENQRIAFTTLEYIRKMADTLYEEINDASEEDGAMLLRDSNALAVLFFTRDVPCEELCAEMDTLTKSVKKQNERYDRLLRVSNQFASMKVPLEEILLKLARIDQKFHVDEIIDRPLNPDLDDDDDTDDE